MCVCLFEIFLGGEGLICLLESRKDTLVAGVEILVEVG